MTRKSIFASLLAVLVLFASSPANAAMNAYLKLFGQKSGEIRGGVTQKGRENRIMVIAAEQTSIAPFNHSTGQVTGPNVNGAFTITKEVDRSSPLLRGALATSEVMTTFELDFWSPQVKAGAGTGAEVQHFTVKLKNARIIGIRFRMQNNKNPELARYAEQEEVSFSYESITWTWNDGGVTWTDTWSSSPSR